MEEAPGVLAVEMRDAMCVGAHRGVRKAGVEGQRELARVEHRHGPGSCGMRFLLFRDILELGAQP